MMPDLVVDESEEHSMFHCAPVPTPGRVHHSGSFSEQPLQRTQTAPISSTATAVQGASREMSTPTPPACMGHGGGREGGESSTHRRGEASSGRGPRLPAGAGPRDGRMTRISELGNKSMSRGPLAGAGQGGQRGGGVSTGRCDFQLQEEFTQTQFFGVFRAHFCYWKHEDVALLITRAVCGYDVVDGGKVVP
jgi:hypothetical protein